jgi:replication factor C subunit 1
MKLLISRNVLGGKYLLHYSRNPNYSNITPIIVCDTSSRVTGQPSSVTNYVVLGSNAGPSKLAVIKKHGLKTLSEDAFLEMIATREVGGEGGIGYDEKTRKKMEKEQEAIRKGAKELEKREREMEKGKGKADNAGR